MSFPTAAQARSQASVNTVVLNEVHAIENAVLASIQAGTFIASNIGATTMTFTTSGAPLALAQSYYNVWRGTETDAAKEANMASVVDHFNKLGYAIKRTVNPSTNSTFLWYVSW